MKYRILAYEVGHKINDLGTFDKFLKKQLVFESPNFLQHKVTQREPNTKIDEKFKPNPKIRDNLPKIKIQESSGSDVDENFSNWNLPYALCDDHGLNELLVVVTSHAQCSCPGGLRHYLRRSFFKPALVLECSAQGIGCNIGRRMAINLTLANTFGFNNMEYQCSSAAAKLTGTAFQNGLNISQFKRTVRQSGLKVSEAKLGAVVAAFATATLDEYEAQQSLIDNAYKSSLDTKIAMDTS